MRWKDQQRRYTNILSSVDKCVHLNNLYPYVACEVTWTSPLVGTQSWSVNWSRYREQEELRKCTDKVFPKVLQTALCSLCWDDHPECKLQCCEWKMKLQHLLLRDRCKQPLDYCTFVTEGRLKHPAHRGRFSWLKMTKYFSPLAD